jgi:hypothetical protein
MKGIMFNETYGLETAVLNGTKTRTWREGENPRYKVGEVVAIKMSYSKVCEYDMDCLIGHEYALEDGSIRTDVLYSAGWSNKMYVKNELMPFQIRITSVNKCRLQDLTDEDCLKEGVNSYKQGNETYYNCEGIYYKRRQGLLKPFKTAKEVFFNLISKLNGYGYWTINPDGYAYEFELIK